MTPFRSTKFIIVFSVLAWSMIQLHVMVLRWFGYSFKVALFDSLVNNILLLSTALLITVILRFYIPIKNRYIYILSLCSVLTIVWFFTSRAIVTLIIDRSE